MSILKHLLKLLPASIALFLILIAFTEFSNIKYFLDIPSALISIFIPILLLFPNYCIGEILYNHRVALTSEESEKKEMEIAAIMFKSLESNFIIVGGSGFVIGIVQVLANLSEPALIGKSLAVAILTFFYGILLKLFYAHPLRVKIERKLADRKSSNQ